MEIWGSDIKFQKNRTSRLGCTECHRHGQTQTDTDRQTQTDRQTDGIPKTTFSDSAVAKTDISTKIWGGSIFLVSQYFPYTTYMGK